MTTSDRRLRSQPTPGIPTGRVLVVVAIVGAVAFGLYIGYLALANDSFPAQEKPFANYASLTSYSFNGTEFAFELRWENASAVPQYAQLTSQATDAANTDVCGLQLSKAYIGQMIFLPFTISPASATLDNVDLNIAVHPLAGSDFTIVFNVASVSATNAPINPSNVTCQQAP